MDSLKLGVLNIVKSAITGEKYNLPEDFDFNEAVKIAKKHSIIPILYYGALNCGVDASNPLMQQLFMSTCQNIAASERQMYEIKNLFSQFENEDIDYLPLKGTLIKHLYPKPEMRTMGDADILIKTEQYDKIKPLIEKMGYTEIAESLCELIWDKKGVLHLELHKAITPPNVEDFYEYFGTGWSKALPVENSKNRYELSIEDHFIFIFTHFARHYRSAGIGIKHIIDFWIYKKTYPNMDYKYIENEFKKLKLYDFYINIEKTIANWFENEECSNVTDFITEIIFENGVFGTKSNEILSESVKMSSKKGSLKEARKTKLLWLIFLPYNLMCLKYPFLKKLPFLLPFMWVVRIITALIFKKDKISKNVDQLNTLNQENIDKRRESLNFVGLDFYSKE